MDGQGLIDFSEQPRSRHKEMQEQFDAFHNENPEVWNEFKKFTFQIIKRGFRNYAVNSIMELVRWHTDVPDVDGRSAFKNNNNHHPFYARKFMTEFPQHDGFFRIRHQKSKEQPPVNREPLGPSDFPYTTMSDE